MKTKMHMNAGVITARIKESRDFYTNILGFGIRYENEFYLLLQAPGGGSEISFLLPGHESQQPLFQTAFSGRGIYLTIEVDDVDQLHSEIVSKGVSIEIPLRDEPWGDRHFAISDPNGVAIDLVTYSGVTDQAKTVE